MINIQHQNIVKQLQHFISIRQIPNILFHGSSGSGKRTIIHDFINQIYDGDRSKIKTHVMYVNCAHGKGIHFIRYNLKYYAKACMQYGHGEVFKSIVLLNADELTIEAQSALRRCIELFSHSTRFFIVVENKYKLLDPIVSRFSEIYIPDATIGNITYTSLHQNNIIKFCETPNFTDFNCLIPIIEKKVETPTHKWFIVFANQLYSNGRSCIDFLEFFENTLGNTHADVITAKFVYNKVKSEYRNEKMALFYMFDYVFLRKNKDIANLAFI
jgi:hypothetical protein